MTEEERDERQRRRKALLLVPLLLLGAALCFWTLFASVNLGEAESFIPAPLGSNALANYGKDDLPGRLRSLSISIVEAVIRDRDPEEENVGSRIEDVIDSLKSPVPTVPGAATGTPTSPPTTTSTLDPTITPTITPTASPSPLPSGTSSATDVPTAGPSPTPSKTPTPITPTPTPLCSAIPYIEILAPTPDQRFNLSQELPAQAFAFDPDNVDPVTCNPAVAIFPTDDGDGIVGPIEVEMRIDWWNGSSWTTVHTEMENSRAYCPFGDIDPFCETHDLSSGEWPGSTPIQTGKHRVWAQALRDDESPPDIPSLPDWHVFYIDPSIITVEDVANTEGSDLTFTVTLDYGVPNPFTVNVSLTDVTATGGAAPLVDPEDYDNVVATLNFSGTTGETQQFTVETLDDGILEGTETFTVSLNASSAWVTDTDTGTGTVIDGPDVCSLITIDNFQVAGSNFVEWDMYNVSGSPVELTEISLTWPSANGDLIHIKIGGTEVWAGADDPPETDTPLSFSEMIPDQVPPTNLHFHFDNNVDSSPYSGLITFSGCTPILISD